MPRARNLKPGFFSNEELGECTPWARLCFAGLWTLADRAGRLEDRPTRIKGELFRFDSIDVEPLLAELQRFKFIVRYEVGGMKLIQVAEFTKHQTPHYSEKPSIIPPQFQEQACHEGTIAAEVSGKGRPLRGGRNPLNPDSRILTPDSPNPESIAPSGLTPPDDDEAPPAGALADVAEMPKKNGRAEAYTVPDCPYDAIVAAYAKALPMLPQVGVVNDARRRAMQARWREVCAAERFDREAGRDWFGWYFDRAGESEFLRGNGRPDKSGRVWRADFDWLLNPTNFARVVEGGRYH